MKKILIFSIAYVPFVGGAEIAVKEITDRIFDIQFDMITLRINKKWPKFERIGNINIYRIGGLKLLFPFNAFFKAASLHAKNKYQAAWAIMANRAGFAALFFKFFNPKVKFLLTLQEGDTLDYPQKRAGILWPLVRFLFRLIFIKADYIQAISSYLAEWARDMGYRGIVEVVPNAVNVEHFSRKYPEQELTELKRKLGKKLNDKYLITTSRLVLKNAVDDVIKSLQYLPESVKFLILGVGPDSEKLQSLVKETRVKERMMFLGQVEHEELPKYLKISDVFIRPSLTEGLGNSFLEAMAAGLPVIATPVGGIPDFLKDRETGLFCDVRNPQSIAEKVNIILKDDKLREKIISNARELVEKEYDWDLIAQKIRAIFQKLCQ